MATDTTTQQYWGDGQPFAGPFGNASNPTIDTTTQQYWDDGQPFHYPYKISGSTPTGRTMPIQLMIVTTTVY